MEIFPYFDLLTVGVTIAGTIILGFATFLNDTKSVTNRAFLFFCLVTIFWGVANYLNYQFEDEYLILLTIRSVMFFAVLQVFSFFTLMFVFPNKIFKFPVWYKTFLIPLVFFTAILTLTPFVFSSIKKATAGVSQPTAEFGIAFFGSVAVGLVVLGIFIMIKKMRESIGIERDQFKFLLIGIIIMFSLIIFFNFLFPNILNNTNFIPFSALFTFPFIFFTSYAIYKHKLFDIKTSAISLVLFILSIFSFFNIIYAEDLSQRVINITFFLSILVGGVALIRGVLKEVRQREKIEKQQKELEVINLKLTSANDRLKELDKQKTEFVSFASHQLRSPLTAIKGYASLILEGDYGAITDDLKHAAQIIFDSTNTLVTVVADYLNVSSIELGQMKYDMKNIDLKDLAASAVEELKKNAESKQISLSFSCDKAKFYPVKADKEKLKQVLMNIIDNSIKYTPKGEVRVSLAENNDKILFSVVDTGIGISKEVIPKLFSKFTRAKNANEANIRGTGLGLFIAKEIITAHHGRIWVESEGEGKGSQFYVELSEAAS